jgi:coproporphyrinogen III oxidase-like Fe-S oxidoreductase
VTCAGCGGDLGQPERISRRDTCPWCGTDLHTCRQCRFYDPSLANACREPEAERVLDKTRGNFCDHFVGAETPKAASAAGAESARAALERLFPRR